jgi:mono/diheme cytochrome c family protein
MAQRLYDRSTGTAAASTSPVAAPADLASTVVDFTQQPLWAYGFPTPPAPGENAEPQRPPSRALRPNEDEREQTKPRSLPGSTGSFSLVDIRDGSNVIDWYPEDHPKMTDIIRLGPSKFDAGRRGCGFCHLPNGLGRPENAPVAGLPPAYFVQQMKDFRNGLRRSSDPRKPNTNTMIDLARAMTDEEMAQAAEYFGALNGSRE